MSKKHLIICFACASILIMNGCTNKTSNDGNKKEDTTTVKSNTANQPLIHDGQEYKFYANNSMHYSLEYPVFMGDIRVQKNGGMVVFLSGEKAGDPMLSVGVLESPPVPNNPSQFRQQTHYQNIIKEDIGHDYVRIDGDTNGTYGDSYYVNYFLFRGKTIYQFMLFYPKKEKEKYNKILKNILASFNNKYESKEVSDGQSESDSFDRKIAEAKWVTLSEGYSLPDFMNTPVEGFVDEVPASVTTYKSDDVELCYWPLLGNWAVNEFPAKGCYVSSNVTIKDITYKQENKGIYSGFTSDGRIFYLKTKVIEGEVDHLKVLALIYPKAKQNSVNKLINSVQSW